MISVIDFDQPTATRTCSLRFHGADVRLLWQDLCEINVPLSELSLQAQNSILSCNFLLRQPFHLMLELAFLSFKKLKFNKLIK